MQVVFQSVDVIVVARGRNPDLSLQSGSFSVGYVREHCVS